jgi:hypothetical protein
MERGVIGSDIREAGCRHDREAWNNAVVLHAMPGIQLRNSLNQLESIYD